MKRCPECRRGYYDDSLRFCLDDGTALLEGPSREIEAPTAIIPGFEIATSGPSPSESAPPNREDAFFGGRRGADARGRDEYASANAGRIVMVARRD
jgi:hypothetical protein